MSTSEQRQALAEPWRGLHKRLLVLGAAILAQRHWGEPVKLKEADEQDKALADLAVEARNIADAISRAALTSAPETAAEPVAWICRTKIGLVPMLSFTEPVDGIQFEGCGAFRLNELIDITPLYPPKAEAAQVAAGGKVQTNELITLRKRVVHQRGEIRCLIQDRQVGQFRFGSTFEVYCAGKLVAVIRGKDYKAASDIASTFYETGETVEVFELTRMCCSWHNHHGAGVAMQQEAAQVAAVTDEMVTAYLTANDAYWKAADELPLNTRDPSKWRSGTPREATLVSLQAALAAAPSQPGVKE